MANIDQTKELNKLLEEQAKIYAAQEKSLKNQFNVTQQLMNLMQGSGLNGMATNAIDLSKAIDGAAQSLENMGGGQQTTDQIKKSLTEAVAESDEFGGSLTKLGKKFLKLAPVITTLEGVSAGFHLTSAALHTVLSVGSSVLTALLNIGAAILAAPFRLLGFLMGQAARGGGTELRQAIEDIRKEFGDLANNESKAIIHAWRRVDHFGGQLAETGLSIWRTMGNMAESLKAVHEIARQLGPTFSNLKGELAENAERMFAYQKGLGLSEEGMAGFGRRAQALGVSLTEVGRETTQMAFGMGRAFGINGKLISRDIGEMNADFENFGNLSISKLSGISVYARKLGVDVKALLGVINKFDNFEDAATSVAQLSQAFGLQLDTLDLVKAQDPAERTEMLRKSFLAAGRSVENMTRQERALLATQTGLDQKTLELVFSQKNASLSYEQIKKQSESSEKQQLSQAEAMQKLSSSIERLVKSGGQMESSFFKIFIDGFTRGVRWTKEWWGLMWKLRRAMREVRYAGRAVGQAFVKYFPGIKDFLGGLQDLFDRRRWHNMLFGSGGVVNIFRNFFKAIAGNDPHAVTNLIKHLKENFFNWFSASEGPGRRILGGFKSFVKAFLQIGGQLFAEAMKALGQAFKGIAGLIRNPERMLGGASEAADGVLGFLIDTLRPAFEAIVEAWPVLRDGFVDLITTAWEKIKPAITGFLSKHWPEVLAVLFGPAIIGGFSRGITFAIGQALVKGTSAALTGSGAKKASSLLASGLSRTAQASSAAAKAGPSGSGGLAPVLSATKQMRKIDATTKGWGVRDATSLGLKLIAIATAIAIGGVEVAGALALMVIILRSASINSISDVILPLTILAAAAAGTVVVSNVTKTLPAGQSGQMLLNLLAAAGALALGGVAFVGALALIYGALSFAGLLELNKIALPFLVLGAALLGTIGLALVALTLEPTTISIATGLMLLGAVMLTISGVAFVGALALINYALKKASMTTFEKAMFPIEVMAAVVGAMIGLSLAVLAMASIANPAVIIVGLIGMVGIFGILYLATIAFKQISDATKDIGMGQIEQTAKGLGAMAMVMSAGAVFALVAAGVGSLILSIGGGIAMIVGMAALAIITQKGAEHTAGIINIINGIPPVDEQKLKVFTTVMNALGSFAGNIASVISATRPSWINLLASPWGRNPQAETKATLGTMNTLLETMGREVRNVIGTIVTHIKDLSPEQLDQSQKMVSLMSALTGLMEAMKPDTELTEGLIGDLLSVQVIQAAGQYFQQVSSMLPGLIGSTVSMMEMVNNLPSIDEGKIKAFSSFIQAIGSLLSAVAPSSGTLGIFATAMGVSELENSASDIFSEVSEALGGPKTTRRTNRTQQLFDIINQYTSALMGVITEGNFLQNIQGFIEGMSNIAGGLDESKLKSLEAVSGIFNTLIGVVSSIAESFSSEGFLKAFTSGPGANPILIQRIFNNLATGIIAPIEKFLPLIISSLAKTTKDMSKAQISRISSVVGIFGEIFGVIPTLIEAVNKLGEGGTDITTGRELFDARLGGVRDLLQAMFSEGAGGSLISILRSISTVVLPRRIDKTLERIGKTIEVANGISEFVSSGMARHLAANSGRAVHTISSALNHMFNPGWRGNLINPIIALGGATIPREAKGNITRLKEIYDQIVGIDFSSLTDQAVAAETFVGDEYARKIGSGVEALIAQINGSNNALKQLGKSPMSLRAELQALSDRLGLKGGGTLRIAHEAVTLNVSVNVTIDAVELQKVLTESQYSELVRNK